MCMPQVYAHLQHLSVGSDVWAWPLLASLFARVLDRDDWMQLWDHLLCMAPQFILHVLAAFIGKISAPLMAATTAEQATAVLLRPAAIMMRGWLQSAYELYERPGVTLPAWKSFAPLAVGESYPASLPMPTAIVNHGAATLEAIRKSEAELARQRALATALEEEESVETARLQQWHAREATLALAEEACRKELAQRRTELEKQAAQTSLALKTARLKGMDARAERLRLAVEAREREHASTMTTLQEQIESAEATAEMQLRVRAEELKLLKDQASQSESLLRAQQAAQAAAARRVTEAAAASRAQQLSLLDKQEVEQVEARLEAARLRRDAEAHRRESLLDIAAGEAREESVEGALREAEFRRTLRSAELVRQAELEAVRQDEEAISRHAADVEARRQRALANQDDEAAQAMLAEQRAWMARRQAERTAILDYERRQALARLESETAELDELERSQRRAEAERRLAEASQLHLAAEAEHEASLGSSLQHLHSAARSAAPEPLRRAVAGAEAAWEQRAQEQRAAMSRVDAVALEAREKMAAAIPDARTPLYGDARVPLRTTQAAVSTPGVPGSIDRAAAYAAAAALPTPGRPVSGRVGGPGGGGCSYAPAPSDAEIRAALLARAIEAGGGPGGGGGGGQVPVGAPAAPPSLTPAQVAQAALPGAASRRAPVMATKAPTPPPIAPPPSAALPPRAATSFAPPPPPSEHPSATAAYEELRKRSEELVPTNAELRTLEMLGCDPALLSELRAGAAILQTPAAPTAEVSFACDDMERGAARDLAFASGGAYYSAGGLGGGSAAGGMGAGSRRSSSLSSGGLAGDALGGLRLSGLDTGLRERLRAEARDGRDSGFAADLGYSARGSSLGSFGLSGESLLLSADAAEHAALVNQYLRDQSAAGQAQAEVEAYMASARSSGGARSSTGSAGGAACDEGSCATCDEIRQRYAEHDEWIASLKESAEAVLATHQRTREALSGLIPDTPAGPDQC